MHLRNVSTVDFRRWESCIFCADILQLYLQPQTMNTPILIIRQHKCASAVRVRVSHIILLHCLVSIFWMFDT